MILEIDAGNSRIKWRMVRDVPGELVAGGKVMSAANSNSRVHEIEQLFFELETQPGYKKISRVRVSSVRGAAFQDAFTSKVKERWALEPEFARVEKECGGVTNSYTCFNKMGVDRWMVMLAAYNKIAGPCCVLDCGSAITFDWINAEGFHQGGYIVPGLHLMRDSLARKTPALDIAIEKWGPPLPGCSTQSAISAGIVAMISGFAEHCYRQVLLDESQAQWFLTGGDAELLSKYLPWAHKVEQDLVLEGLAIALP